MSTKVWKIAMVMVLALLLCCSCELVNDLFGKSDESMTISNLRSEAITITKIDGMYDLPAPVPLASGASVKFNDQKNSEGIIIDFLIGEKTYDVNIAYEDFSEGIQLSIYQDYTWEMKSNQGKTIVGRTALNPD